MGQEIAELPQGPRLGRVVPAVRHGHDDLGYVAVELALVRVTLDRVDRVDERIPERSHAAGAFHDLLRQLRVINGEARAARHHDCHLAGEGAHFHVRTLANLVHNALEFHGTLNSLLDRRAIH